MTADPVFLQELQSAAAEIELDLNGRQLHQMDRLRGLVLLWNQRLNLTRITDSAEMAVKHFIDSLTPVKYDLVPAGCRFIDVGSGAGFPGVPLKLWDESLEATLLESTRKKADFLREVARELPIDLEVVNQRAEDTGVDPRHRELYDLAIARAVGSFDVLCEYCLPLVRPGGRFVAMKGPDVDAEVTAGQRAVRLLGGEVSERFEYDLPLGMGRRTLVVVTKVAVTPPAYPRRAGIPKKNPL